MSKNIQEEITMRRTDGIHAGGRTPLYKNENMTERAFLVELLERYESTTQEELAKQYNVSRQTIYRYLRRAKEVNENGRQLPV